MTKKELDQLRDAIADYMASEGCGCCRNHDAHDANRKRIGELLKIRADKEGWHDFSKFGTASRR